MPHPESMDHMIIEDKISPDLRAVMLSLDSALHWHAETGQLAAFHNFDCYIDPGQRL